MHQSSILTHMGTTLNLDDELLRRAREYTGVQEKTAPIHAALRQFPAHELAAAIEAAMNYSMTQFDTSSTTASVASSGSMLSAEAASRLIGRACMSECRSPVGNDGRTARGAGR
jgi:Arc/MetJ family transcription regulator